MPARSRLTWGGGGTSAGAVAALYGRLVSQGRSSVDSSSVPGPESPSGGGRSRTETTLDRSALLMAADEATYHDAVHRVRALPEPVDVIIRTSGSTDGAGRLVGLSRAALEASAQATHARLAGPGQWVTSLPIHGIAGFQVVLRSALAGHEPVAYDPAGGFDADLLARALERLTPGIPHYLSLVPTQLHRALGIAPDLLAAFDAVLVGGAALAADLAARADRSGVTVVRTYGSTETSGGCVYDGVPLDGVQIELVDGLIHVSGPTLATGYLDTDTQPFVERAGRHWLATHDLGAWVGGRLEVRGRADDVIISGGTNVNPLDVENALATLGGEWVVVGVPDAQWGQRVTAVGTLPVSLHDVRRVTAHLGAAGRPRQVVHVAALPLRPTGKLDRRAALRLAEQA